MALRLAEVELADLCFSRFKVGESTAQHSGRSPWRLFTGTDAATPDSFKSAPLSERAYRTGMPPPAVLYDNDLIAFDAAGHTGRSASAPETPITITPDGRVAVRTVALVATPSTGARIARPLALGRACNIATRVGSLSPDQIIDGHCRLYRCEVQTFQPGSQYTAVTGRYRGEGVFLGFFTDDYLG